MVHLKHATVFPPAASSAGRKTSPFSSTANFSKGDSEAKPVLGKRPRILRNVPLATLKRQLLMQKQRLTAAYLAQALPKSYRFHAFSTPKGLLHPFDVSKTAYKFSAMGFVIHRPAPLSEIFVFLRLANSQSPFPVLQEIRNLKIMGKIVLSVLSLEDLAFHLASLGVELQPVCQNDALRHFPSSKNRESL